jgi:hypothetical protein
MIELCVVCPHSTPGCVCVTMRNPHAPPHLTSYVRHKCHCCNMNKKAGIGSMQQHVCASVQLAKEGTDWQHAAFMCLCKSASHGVAMVHAVGGRQPAELLVGGLLCKKAAMRGSCCHFCHRHCLGAHIETLLNSRSSSTYTSLQLPPLLLQACLCHTVHIALTCCCNPYAACCSHFAAGIT